MSTPSGKPHIHSAALSALLARDQQGRTKSDIAVDAGMTPANLREFETSTRSGARTATRLRVAAALDVPVGAITCWCDRPAGICRSLEEHA